MIFRNLRALCLAPGGPGSIWNHFGAPVRSTAVSRWFGCGFRPDFHFADDGVTVVPFICASGKTHLTKISGDQHAWSLYLTRAAIVTIILCTRNKCTYNLVGLFPGPPNGANYTDEAWHSTVETMHWPHQDLDINNPGLKWNCVNDFQSQYTHIWLPGSGIIQNTLELLNTHMAHAWCVKFLKVRSLGIEHFDSFITQRFGMFTLSICTKQVSMFCTLLVFIQSIASSCNTLSAMSIVIGSLIICISRSWV